MFEDVDEPRTIILQPRMECVAVDGLAHEARSERVTTKLEANVQNGHHPYGGLAGRDRRYKRYILRRTRGTYPGSRPDQHVHEDHSKCAAEIHERVPKQCDQEFRGMPLLLHCLVDLDDCKHEDGTLKQGQRYPICPNVRR